MNSTPGTPSSTIRLTAFPPPPPTPTILTSVNPLAAVANGASTILGTIAAGRLGSSSRAGSKPPRGRSVLATAEHLLGKRRVHLGGPLGAEIAKDGFASRTGFEHLAAGADLGLEDERAPPLAQIFGDLLLLAQP